MTHDATVALAAGITGRPLTLVESCLPWKATSQVLRCRFGDTGETVIVKRSEEPDGPLMREWAALEFLGGIEQVAALFPAVIVGDREHEIIVLSDLGFPEEQRLGSILEGDDPALAEAALVSQQRALGRMHAATAGRLDEFKRLLLAKGRVRDSRHGANRLEELARDLPNRLSNAGAPARLDDEIESVVGTLSDPGPFLVLSHGDGTPANACFDGTDTRLFDLESAAPRHALVDGAYAPIRFLNSTWASRFPEPVAARALAAYRE
ncbi:MAG: phosphotransferase, partial [Planctomycetota bacterium]